MLKRSATFNGTARKASHIISSIFAKVLEKLVHTRLLNYFLTNNIISEYQFVFLPGRSTQLAVFELTKQIYSSMNNKKIFGAICLDLSKVFDCINPIDPNPAISARVVFPHFSTFFQNRTLQNVGTAHRSPVYHFKAHDKRYLMQKK